MCDDILFQNKGSNFVDIVSCLFSLCSMSWQQTASTLAIPRRDTVKGM